MQEVFKWLLQYWRIVLEVVLLIASVVILIIKKKPVNTIMEALIELCISGVLYAERVPGIKGDQKLEEAISYVNDKLLETYPDLDISRYRGTIKACIELILKTPQKKGD